MACSSIDRPFYIICLFTVLVFFVLPIVLISAFTDWNVIDSLQMMLLIWGSLLLLIGLGCFGPCKKYLNKLRDLFRSDGSADNSDAPTDDTGYGEDNYGSYFNREDEIGNANSTHASTTNLVSTNNEIDYVYAFNIQQEGNVNEAYDFNDEDETGADPEDRRRREVVELEQHVTKLLAEVQRYSEYLSDSPTDIVLNEQSKLVAWLEEQAAPSDEEICKLKTTLGPIAAKVNRLKNYRNHRVRQEMRIQSEQDVNAVVSLSDNRFQDGHQSNMDGIPDIPPPAYADIYPEQIPDTSINSYPAPSTDQTEISATERPQSPPAYEEAMVQ